MDTATKTEGRATPWNKGKLLGQKPPLKLKEIWAIRIRLQLARRARELALFNLAIDSKLRGCDLVAVAARAHVARKHRQVSRDRGRRCSGDRGANKSVVPSDRCASVERDGRSPANSSQSRSKKPTPGMTGVKPRADATRRRDCREEIHNADAQRSLTPTI
jgi:hypothetical protein